MDVFVGGAWRTVIRGEIYVGGQWRTLKRGESYKDENWRSVANFTPPLSVTAPDTTGESTVSPVTSLTVTATPTGGVAPFSYAWTRLTGGATILAPSSASTAFRQTLFTGQIAQTTASVSVTDAAGSVASTTTTITLVRISGGGGGPEN